MKKRLLRALGLMLTQSAIETGLMALFDALFSLRVAIVNAALLFLATSALGAVWAIRTRARRSPASPALGAALAPLVSCALFLLPRFVLGPLRPALATLAIVALLVPLVERAWSEPDDRTSSPFRAALAASPIAAIGFLAALELGQAWYVVASSALVLATFVGAVLFRAEEGRLAQKRRFVERVRAVEVRPDAVILPPPARFSDPVLTQLDRELAARADLLALEARADARARELVEDARLLRTRLMASMSHELRSPLNSIVGFAQILERGMEGELTPEQMESVTVIRRSAEELILLLTDIIDLARLEAGKIELHRAWTPSVEILTEAMRRARAIVEGREVEIDAELQPGLPPVHVDPARIVQAVVALFRNAATSLNRTRIRLRARTADGPPGPARQLRLEIHDALGAIPKEEVERIFEAFQEITEPSGRRVGGLGMALTLSRGLVRLHGGEVWADSVRGEGAVLCVGIPLEKR